MLDPLIINRRVDRWIDTVLRDHPLPRLAREKLLVILQQPVSPEEQAAVERFWKD